MGKLVFAKKDDYFNRSLLPAGIFHWSEVKNHIDENITFYGEVTTTFFDNDQYELCIRYPELGNPIPPTFLEIGARFPSKYLVKIVIWGADRHKFSIVPDQAFKGKAVVISGKPYMYNDLVCVRVEFPGKIKVVEPIENLYLEKPWNELLEESLQPVFFPSVSALEPRESHPSLEDVEDDLGVSFRRIDLGTHEETFMEIGDFILTSDGEYVDPDEYRARHYRNPDW